MKLKVCSFNARFASDHESDGINNFFCRTGRIAEFLKETDPDVIGFQEITPEMREWFVDNMPDYYIVGGGRNSDYSGESSMIGFKKRDMMLISCDTVALSSAPSVPGSRYEGSDQSRCPRIYTRIKLAHKDIDTPFYAYNVHTDHVGKISRTLAIMQLVQDVSGHDLLFVMTGDFNARPDAGELNLITKNPRFVDTTADLGYTFHDFGRYEGAKIDYIFADARLKVVESCRTHTDAIDGVYVSDHCPIYTVFDI